MNVRLTASASTHLARFAATLRKRARLVLRRMLLAAAPVSSMNRHPWPAVGLTLTLTAFFNRCERVCGPLHPVQAWRDLREHRGLLHLPQKHRQLSAGLSSQSGRHALWRYGLTPLFFPVFFFSFFVWVVCFLPSPQMWTSVKRATFVATTAVSTCWARTAANAEMVSTLMSPPNFARVRQEDFRFWLWSRVYVGESLTSPLCVFYRLEWVQVLSRTLRSPLWEHGGLLPV